jgi:hypothetical protein
VAKADQLESKKRRHKTYFSLAEIARYLKCNTSTLLKIAPAAKLRLKQGDARGLLEQSQARALIFEYRRRAGERLLRSTKIRPPAEGTDPQGGRAREVGS